MSQDRVQVKVGDSEYVVYTLERSGKLQSKVRVRDVQRRRFLPFSLLNWSDGGQSVSVDCAQDFVQTFRSRLGNTQVQKASITVSSADLAAFLAAVKQR